MHNAANQTLTNLRHAKVGCSSNNIKHISNVCDVYMREKDDKAAERSNSNSELQNWSYFGRRRPARLQEKTAGDATAANEKHSQQLQHLRSRV